MTDFFPAGRPWGDSRALQRAAEQLVLDQQMVVEHGPHVAPPQPLKSEPLAQPSKPATTARQPLRHAHAATGSGVEATLVQHIKGVGPQKAKALISKFGNDIVAVLNAPDAAQHLVRVAGIGPVLAARFKASWDANAPLAGGCPRYSHRSGNVPLHSEFQCARMSFRAQSSIARMCL